MSVTIDVTTHVDPDTTDAVWALYDAVFADQPDRDAWQAMWQTHTSRPGFRIARATTESGTLVGFVYGYTGAAGQWWTDRAIEHLPHEVASTWLGGHLEVVSLAVAPDHRQRGIGRALMEALLTPAGHDRSVLMTTADPTDAAHRLYLATGWHVIGPGIRPHTVIMATSRA